MKEGKKLATNYKVKSEVNSVRSHLLALGINRASSISLFLISLGPPAGSSVLAETLSWLLISRPIWRLSCHLTRLSTYGRRIYRPPLEPAYSFPVSMDEFQGEKSQKLVFQNRYILNLLACLSIQFFFFFQNHSSLNRKILWTTKYIY